MNANPNMNHIDGFRAEYNQLKAPGEHGQPGIHLPPFEEWLYWQAVRIERERCAQIAEAGPGSILNSGQGLTARGMAYHIAEQIRTAS